MLKKIRLVLLVLLGLLAALALYATTRPDTFRVERRILVQATPDKLQPLLADFHQWPAWSPWEKLDPAMQRTFSGPAAGVGAAYAWQGNKDVGSGRMEVLHVSPDTVDIQLDFIEPFAGHNLTRFSLAPQAGGTEVRWVMSGPSPYISKLMGVFISMDSLIGKDFEKGLAQLKAAAEK